MKLNTTFLSVIFCVTLLSCTKEQNPTAVTSVTLDKEQIILEIGENATITATVKPDNAADKSVTWSSTDASVASVSGGVVTALKLGTTTITAKAGDKTASCSVFVTNYVDLGLSVKWATCNVGASKPEESGTAFAWGDVTGQTWTGTSWTKGGFYDCPAYEVGLDNNLKPEYDAAHTNIGEAWRMPTETECKELIDNCSSSWTDNYNNTGVAGKIFKSKKAGYTDKYIFLPAAGSGINYRISYAGTFGYYWSGTFSGGYYAWGFCFGSYDFLIDRYYRGNGFFVRPVSE